ncbi:MAG TPA: glycoside hydrolase family 36 protein [Rubrobacter sp.]|nr:glycoside hydrolase family 36 protein [Rubrobacter sp.]
MTDNGYEVRLDGGGEEFRGSLSNSSPEDGVELVRVRIEADETGRPPAFRLSWTHPLVSVHGFWHPGAGYDKGLSVDWGKGFYSKATSGAPVGCLYDLQGRNRLTFAFSDALNPIIFHAGVHEESAEVSCWIQLFDEPLAPLSIYEATLRLDARHLPYSDALSDVSRWWASLPGYEPAGVPETARLPMYSTWYSFHQDLDPGRVEEQCRLAKEIGCEAVIVDDGWQTTSNERGYAYTGDWEPTPEKVPDMRAHVDRVHDLGMKFLLWYSVPFVGVHSRAWERFSGMLLAEIERLGAGVLDPRFPEVREFLIGTYETALREWDLDGFKLDFVDSFGTSQEIGGGRDYDGVPEAVDRLLEDTISRLRQIKPDVMVEFRQSYVGPLMRKYGNMFRAMDCPNDAVENRMHTLDIRLLGGNTATHSDMLMWHHEDPVHSAALQLVNVLFSVPQISVLLDRIPPEHFEMLRFWLGFWREHRDVFLDGEIKLRHPEAIYPVVLARTDTKLVAAAYGNAVVLLEGEIPSTLLIVNGTLEDGVVLKLADDAGTREVEVRDCRGRVTYTEIVELETGLHEIDVPSAGVAVLR